MADQNDKDTDTTVHEGQYSKEVAAVMSLLAECGVTEYDPRVVSMLMDIQYAVTSKILETANGLSRHQEKQRIDSEDIQTAADMIGVLGSNTPNREKMLQLAQDKNAQPLPAIRHNYGLKLPNDRFCQLQPNVVYKAEDDYQMEVQQHHPHPSHIIPPPSGVYRNEHLQNMLKRRAPDDDFDS